MSAVSIVIPHYNGKEIIQKCLASLMMQTYKDFNVIVVDNASTDKSGDNLEIIFPEKVSVLRMDHNTGFAYAVNKGIEWGIAQKSEYVFVLNNDTIVDSECLEKLVHALNNYPNAAAVQPKILNAHHPEIIDSMGIVITRDMSALNKNQSIRDGGVFWADQEIFGSTGAAVLYRTETLETVRFPDGDYFDTSYFAYYEDVDMSFRLQYAGFTSWCIPSAVVWHEHSTTGISYSGFKSFHIHRNHLYNIIKNAPFPYILSMFWRIPFRYILLLSSVFTRKGPSHRLREKLPVPT
jgi:GT2 family glycosyltransferase